MVRMCRKSLRTVLAFILVIGMLLPVQAASGTEETGTLPEVRLTIDEEEWNLMLASTDHSYRAPGGSISVEVPDGFTGEFGSELLKDTGELPLAYIRGRGNSTWLGAKKPFKFKLEEGADLLGMGKDKHWVLLANAYDGSLLRSSLMSYVGRTIGLAYTPLMVPVDFYVNDEYMGSYVLCHQVRKGKARVNIGDEGYLLAMNPYEKELNENRLTTSRGIRFLAEDPVFASDDPSDVTAPEARKDEIMDILQNAEDAIFGEGFQDKEGRPYTDFMDLQSAVRYWWVEEFFMNGDGAYTPSTYLYAADGKLYWGPLWDFDLSCPLGFTSGFSNTHTPWLDHLRAFDDDYRDALKKEWVTFSKIIDEVTEDGGIIDQYAERIRGSWERNQACGFDSDSFQKGEFDEQVTALKQWFIGRKDWIDQNIDISLDEVNVSIYFYVDGEYLTTSTFPLNPGQPGEADFPETPEKEGAEFQGWITDRGEYVVPGVTLIDNTPVYAVFTSYEQPESEER